MKSSGKGGEEVERRELGWLEVEAAMIVIIKDE